MVTPLAPELTEMVYGITLLNDSVREKEIIYKKVLVGGLALWLIFNNVIEIVANFDKKV